MLPCAVRDKRSITQKRADHALDHHLVIEHNLDIMAEADWIVDLGPDDGDGRIVAQGAPEAIARRPGKSHTAKILGEFLTERGVA